jgi:hypothetical protein
LVPAALLDIYAAVTVVTVVRALRERRWRLALLPAVASACLVVVSARWLLVPGVKERCRPSEYLMSAQLALGRQDTGGVYAALNDCLECVRVHANAPSLPPVFQVFARDFLVLAGRMGRVADATATLRGLRAAYAADPVLPQLLASTGGVAAPPRP